MPNTKWKRNKSMHIAAKALFSKSEMRFSPVALKTVGDKVEFKVHWAGFSSDDATWESPDAFSKV